MIVFQYTVKLLLVGAFSHKIWQSIMNLFDGDILFELVHGLYGLIFLFFVIIYKPSKKANISPVVIFVVLAHVVSPFLFSMGRALSYEALIFSYILMSVGFLISVVSVIDLGKSFDVFPVHKTVVTRGMYQYVRHPIYLGYIITATGVLASWFSIYNLFVFCLLLALTVARISFEEWELLKDRSYQSFKGRVTYRLLPKFY